MKYKIHYSCISHKGKCRSMNQDNFICDGKYWETGQETITFPMTGVVANDRETLFGIFDGMGGEECGEVAAMLAAKKASGCLEWKEPVQDMVNYCREANEEIVQYMEQNEIKAMGTTAAMLLFTKKDIFLCNIGDSKVFRFANKNLEQISMDHVMPSAYGTKPPLAQNLGIPTDEMVIDPYIAHGKYHNKEVYLICSDGLTDMVEQEEIRKILLKTDVGKAAKILLKVALKNGGKDNITVIVCRIERKGIF